MSHSIFSYEPFYDFDRFFEAISPPSNQQVTQARRALENNDGAIRSLRPRMDLHENKDTNQVTATFELPGVKKEDINIDLHNGRLIISAETKASTEHEQGGYAVRERRFGKVSRTLQLPQGVKEDEIKASLEDGILTLAFPKTVPESASKKITVA